MAISYKIEPVTAFRLIRTVSRESGKISCETVGSFVTLPEAEAWQAELVKMEEDGSIDAAG